MKKKGQVTPPLFLSTDIRKYMAEVFGTWALVFAGCGAIIVNDLHGGVLGHTGICLVFGLVILAMIYAVGNISGAHLNPAVTIGFYAAGRLDFKQVVPYIAAQIAGALSAGLILRFLFPEHEYLGATVPAGTTQQSFLLEVILTFLLMFVILNVSSGHKEKGIMAGVAVGATVALAALMGGPVSGASMNPARSIGPAVISGQIQSLWIYTIAPVTGAVLASPTCRIIQGDECCFIARKNETQ